MAAFLVYCSSRDGGVRIFVIATTFQSGGSFLANDRLHRIFMSSQTGYRKAATCERQQLAGSCQLVNASSNVRCLLADSTGHSVSDIRSAASGTKLPYNP